MTEVALTTKSYPFIVLPHPQVGRFMNAASRVRSYVLFSVASSSSVTFDAVLGSSSRLKRWTARFSGAASHP